MVTYANMQKCYHYSEFLQKFANFHKKAFRKFHERCKFAEINFKRKKIFLKNSLKKQSEIPLMEVIFTLSILYREITMLY